MKAIAAGRWCVLGTLLALGGCMNDSGTGATDGDADADADADAGGDADADADADGDADADADADADGDADLVLAALLETAEPALSGFPGIAIGVVHRGQVRVAARGLLSSELDDPLTTRSRFNVGLAFSSTLNGAVALEARIDRDRPVTEIVPEFSVAASPEGQASDVLVRHVLNDSSGVLSLHRFGGECSQTLEEFWTSSPQPALLFEPGSLNAGVSGWGRSLAGLVLERELAPVAQMFPDVVRTFVFEPAGMTGATHSPNEPDGEYAWGHEWFGAAPRREDEECPPQQPYDRVYASIEDVTAFARWLLLERPDLREALTADSVDSIRGGMLHGYGLDTEQLPPAGRLLITTSSWYGYHVVFLLLPDLDFALVKLANASLAQGWDLDGELLATALDVGFGLTLEPRDASLRLERWDEYAGTYQQRSGREKILEVTWVPDERALEFSVDGSAPRTLAPLTFAVTRITYPDTFVDFDALCGGAPFWRDADDNVDRAATMGCAEPLFYRVE